MEAENKLIVRRLVAGVALIVMGVLDAILNMFATAYLSNIKSPVPFLESQFVLWALVIVAFIVEVIYIGYRKKHLERRLKWPIVIESIILMFLFSLYVPSRNVDVYILMALLVLGLSFGQEQSDVKEEMKKSVEIPSKQTQGKNKNDLSQLVELKKLLDSGVSTQEDFDTKKETDSRTVKCGY